MEAQNTNLMGWRKIILKCKFGAIHAYIKIQERFQINILTLCLKELERKNIMKIKLAEKREIIKIRTKTNKTENVKTRFTWLAIISLKT